MTSDCPFPSRRELHHRAQSNAAVAADANVAVAEKPAATGRSVGTQRAAMLIALGAATVAAPLTGFVGSHSSVELPARQLGTIGAASEDFLPETDAVADASDLNAVAAAASRTRLRDPLKVGQCLAGIDPANGARAVTEMPAIQYPMASGTYELTSPFSMRVNPVTGVYKMHEGVDFAAPLDTPIYAAMDGVVTEVQDDSSAGRMITIQHTLEDGSTVYTCYLHQYPDQVLVSVGQQVKAGDHIAGVGNAGNSTGPHLHFEVRLADKTPVDPITWLDDHAAVFPGQGC